MVPSFESFFLPFLQLMQDHKEHTLKELVSHCAKALNLTDDDKAERTKNGSTKVYDRTQWTGTYFKKAKVIESVGRGVYKITERGESLLKNSNGIIRRYDLDQYPEFCEFAYGNTKIESENNYVHSSKESKTPSEIIEEAHNELSNSLAEELLDIIKSKSAKYFERLVVKVLVEMGYGGSIEDAASVTQYSHDEGIDGIIKEDKLGLDKIYVQAKRYTDGSIGRKEIQSFVGALSGKGANKGIFITTSTFTKEAKEYTPASNIKVVLIDGEQLCKYMIEYNIGVSIKETYYVKRIDTDFFNEDE